MEKTILLKEIFPLWETTEPLSELRVRHVDLHPQNRSVCVRLDSGDDYIPQGRLQQAAKAIGAVYDLKQVSLHVDYPPALLAQFDFTELQPVFTAVNPLSRAALAGAKWDFDGQSLTVTLQAGGTEYLEPGLAAAQGFIRDHFHRDLPIHLRPGSDLSGQALFEATEAMRLDAIKNAPATPAPVQKPPETVRAMPEDLIFGKPFSGRVTPMGDVVEDMFKVIVEGEVIDVNHKELPKRKATVVNFVIADATGAVRINRYLEDRDAKAIVEAVKAGNKKKHKPGSYLRVYGKVTQDRFEREMIIDPYSIMKAKKPQRTDTAAQKRVELHLHTTMSAMDALTDTTLAVKQAAAWGMPAIGITDHGGAQGYPDALHAVEGGCQVAGTDEPIKILYGCEGYYVNDIDDRIVVHGGLDASVPCDYVAFDLETTGLSARKDVITEIGAVIFRNGQPCERFQTFVNPHRKLEQKIIDLTGITDAMLADAPDIETVLPAFLDFCAELPLCAHNADFDVGFITAACRRLGLDYAPTYIDTLILAQNLMPKLGKYKLNIVANALSLPDFQHHRASDDAVTCGYLLARFFPMLLERDITTLQAVNPAMMALRAQSGHMVGRRNKHILLFAKNQLGLRNLYQLISKSNLEYFIKKYPRMPKSELLRHREGLIIGSACEAGELFQAILDNKSEAELERIADFYDFLEIQPLCNNRFLIDEGKAADEHELMEFNRTVVRLGKKLGKPVVATGDVHFLNPEDEIFRHILLATKGFEDADRALPLYLRTTEEMLEEFAYLGEETAFEVVVTNTNRIADMCDTVRPVPHNLFAPSIENSVEDLKSLVYGKLHRLYGENPPELITKRVETELNDIINCHYDVIYMSAQKLVQNSLEHGYLVGSRGSVGSSIVAYLSGITEVNSFPPHYRCPNPDCKFCSFEPETLPVLGEDDPDDGIRERILWKKHNAACGADLPDAVCPQCGTRLEKDGFNIPFETFLGFGGDKVPDIDLNFSGEYQARAHAYCVELFGASHVFRAGTIGTVADKTAFGYVKKYQQERNLTMTRAEETRLAIGCSLVKRTTGQHPGGLIVIPQENEIWDFCPVQHPADDPGSDIITTHFEYHCMEENLLKLDMLGHDDPTMIRMLEDLTGVDAKLIPLDDQDTMSIFKTSEAFGYTDDPVLGPVGSCGIPEFGTGFTRGMLQETQPTEFDTLIRLSGFSHGTDVWLGNARDLILSNTATVGQAIGCRDDIMLYLIKCGMPEQRSFKIMEAVRKGRGLPEGAEQEMISAGVPDWYIGSCKKIKYLFPKAHAVAYVMMAFRIAWFKVHEPVAFYAAYFYRRSQKGNFDAALMCGGIEQVKDAIQAIKANPDATAKDDDLFTTLEVCYEFYRRGYSFLPLSLTESHATKFIPKGQQLLPPFVAVSGLGETAAWDIYNGRQGKAFISIEEFALACPKVSQTHIENLKAAGAFGDLPDTSQVSLF